MEPLPSSRNNFIIIIALACVIMLVGGIFIYFYVRSKSAPEVLVGPTINFFPVVQDSPEEATFFPESVTNPISGLPTNNNPFAAQTNPFEDAYQNPFE